MGNYVRMKKTLPGLVLALFLLFCGPAAAADPIGSTPSEADPYITSGEAARDFREARKTWLAKDIANYRITAHRSCFCAGPFKTGIRVRKGKPVRIASRPWYGPRTVPGMFRIVGQAIKREAAELDVRYHPKLGFPKRASIDYVAMLADDEMYYRINHFRRLRR